MSSLVVHRADNGKSYPFTRLNPDTTVDQLKDALAISSGISVADQILLTAEGYKFDRGKPIEAYRFPGERVVFLYDRRKLQSDYVSGADLILPNVEVQVPPTPPPPREQEYDKSPLYVALLKYDYEFTVHLNTALAYRKALETRLNICKGVFTEQEIQVAAVDAAVTHLQQHLRQVGEAYKNFQGMYQRLYEKHEKLLASFPGDMDRLRNIPLHIALRRDRMNTLMDVIPEQKLRLWAEDCAAEHAQLAIRVAELDKQVTALREQAVAAAGQKCDVDFKSLQASLQRAGDIVGEVALHTQLFSGDLHRVKDRLEESTKVDGSQWTLCDGLDDMKKIHSHHIGVMMKHEETLKLIAQHCMSSKIRLAKSAHDRVRHMAYLQSRIRELAQTIIGFHEALVRQKTAFQQLVYVQCLPRAYQASLDEISRRRRFGQKLNALTTKCNQLLAKIQHEETAKRQTFLSTFGTYVPKDLVVGLGDALPPFELTLPPFDGSLPAVSAPGPLDEEDFTLVLSDASETQSRIVLLEQDKERLVNELKTLRGELEVRSSRQLMPAMSPEVSPRYVKRLQEDLAQSIESSSDYRKRIESLEQQLSQTFSQMSLSAMAANDFKQRYEQTEQQLSEARSGGLRRSSDDERSALRRAEVREAELANALSAAEESVRRLTAELEQRKSDLQQLSTELEQSRQSAAESLQKLEVARMEKERLQQDLDRSRQWFSEHERRFSESRRASEASNATIAALEAQLAELKERLTDEELKVAAAQQQFDDVQRLHIEAVRDGAASKAQLLRLEAAREAEVSASQLSSDREAQVNALSSQLAMAQAEVQSHQERMEQLRAELGAAEAKLRKQEKKLAKAEARAADLEAKLSQEQFRIEELQTSIENYKATANALEDEKSRALAAAEQSRLQAEQAEEDKTKTLSLFAKLNEKLNRATAALASLESERAAWADEKARLEQQLQMSSVQDRERWEQEQRSHQEVAQTLQRDNAALLAAQQQAQQALAEHVRAVEAARDEAARAAERAASAQARADQLEADVHALRRHESDVQSEVLRLQAEIERLRVELRHAASAKGSTDEALAARVGELEIRLQEREQELQQKSNNLQALSSKFVDAVKSLETKNARALDLQKANAALERRAASAEEELAKVQSALHDALSKTSSADLETSARLQQAVLTIDQSLHALPKDLPRPRADAPVADKLSALHQALTALTDQRASLSKQSRDLSGKVAALGLELENSRVQSQRKIQDLESQVAAWEMNGAPLDKTTRFATSNFQHNDNVLFLPNAKGEFEAFNIRCPNYYLSPIVLETLDPNVKKAKSPVMGQIVEISEHKASPGYNPFDLPVGTAFYEVIIMQLP